ncbi:hypothetical protein [Mesorhizobium sp.]|uniref:hypothetical protein n=1 Tax=Mesorhizobium sp. TaxID=1871066 RepID=UPI000FE7A657|nr:hypothetical protein [Mesorhizobium sp.]RWP30586.1 MAG: hypothetical protein EOR02_12625 [Mesorhizobium sp.]RWQ53681.1 MAG: hypothetical protein EOS82_08870 [Mesorhizobium sp.]
MPSEQRFTRTINPLQFDALEPKRFEDLVRQLLYDFRQWRQLEPTGRMGSDDGFDARGWEVISIDIDEEYPGEEGETPLSTDRIWLVQCKREKAIGPTKLVEYLENISKEELAGLYGIIIAAPADFSKKSRDAFRLWCSEHSISECHLWGKAELEDSLFQPKNDHLLFAYFGLSLTIRRRSLQTQLRAQTTIKRKLKRAIEKDTGVLLIRDVEDERYPYTPSDLGEPAEDENHALLRWWVHGDARLTHRGLEVIGRKYFAFIDRDEEHWDAANVLDDAPLSQHQDPWRGRVNSRDDRQKLYEFWASLPEGTAGWLTIWGIIPLEHIVEVDDVGDDLTEHPHIYVKVPKGELRPFGDSYPVLSYRHGWGNPPDITLDTRVEKFPAEFRKPFPIELESPRDESQPGT